MNGKQLAARVQSAIEAGSVSASDIEAGLRTAAALNNFVAAPRLSRAAVQDLATLLTSLENSLTQAAGVAGALAERVRALSDGVN